MKAMKAMKAMKPMKKAAMKAAMKGAMKKGDEEVQNRKWKNALCFGFEGCACQDRWWFDCQGHCQEQTWQGRQQEGASEGVEEPIHARSQGSPKGTRHHRLLPGRRQDPGRQSAVCQSQVSAKVKQRNTACSEEALAIKTFEEASNYVFRCFA